MKIIGEDESAKSRITCVGTKYAPGCGAVLEYVQSDIITVNNKDYGNGSSGRNYIICLRCLKQLTLNSW